jgi:TRAP-type C4-dicarboxylate transport system substrate-binding protein
MQVVTLNIKSLIETVPEVAVLMRPYLFSSYEEAEAVYDGAVGKKILDAITERTNARALAFTYSGGFMIVQSNTQSFTTASDFKNKRIATINGSTSGENISALGAEAVVLPIGDYSNKELNQMVGEYDGVETTYTRLTGATPRFITETNHSLLITAVLVDKTFFSSLSLSEQTALQEAATIAARAERQESRALAAKNKQALIDSGTRISTLSPSARDEFVRNTSYLYTKYPEETGLVETIRKNQ